MNTIGIFNGKQKTHNILLLTLLYDNEPLSAWELTAKLGNVGNRVSLHATFNKRLRNLEQKGYLKREQKKWFLTLKGILAVLLIQQEPKMWGSKWNELFIKSAKTLEENSEQILGLEKTTVQNAFKGFRSLGLFLDDFNAWVNLSKKVKTLMKKGVIDFDLINEETLFEIITMETIKERMDTKDLRQLMALFEEGAN